MKKLPFFLKSIFTICVCATPLFAKEIVVNTSNGEAFCLQVTANETLNDVTQHIESLISDKDGQIIIEMRMDDVSPYDSELITWNAKAHGQFLGQPRDYYAAIRENEKNDIRFIITCLANKSLLSIARHKGDLERAGDRIDHLHPLVFLRTVFGDEELKVGIRNIRGKGWVWSEFISGIKDSLNTEANNSNMRSEHVHDFAKYIGIDVNLIFSSIQGRRWDEFIDILITKIPRGGNYHRYDS